MLPWGYKALVPKEKFVSPNPVITSFYPGHDMRVLSTDKSGEKMHIKIEFSDEMDCNSISNNLRIDSTVETGGKATVDLGSARCSSLSNKPWTWVGEPRAAFMYEADLNNVRHGVHQVTIINPTSTNGKSTNSVDRFLFRCGNFDNPMVFPKAANYTKSLLFKDDGRLHVSHSAAGADMWRYSLNFGTTFSDWAAYTGGNSTLEPRVWSGAKTQAWKGEHVIVQYWTAMGGSSDHYVHGDLDSDLPPRRFPNIFLMGPFNRFGLDAGLSNKMQLDSDGVWKIDFMDEWPAQVQLNAWGINPDGKPDVSEIYGDIDGGE
jgi:alpha-1,3-glucan synthase